MCDSYSLPGIQSIAYVPANMLPADLTMQALSSVSVKIMTELFHIPFSGEPTCECTNTNERGASSEVAELSFFSTLLLPEHIYLAFVVLDANGRFFLIGTREEHPRVERVQNLGSPSTDPNTFSYSVRLTAPRALIPCRICP